MERVDPGPKGRFRFMLVGLAALSLAVLLWWLVSPLLYEREPAAGDEAPVVPIISESEADAPTFSGPTRDSEADPQSGGETVPRQADPIDLADDEDPSPPAEDKADEGSSPEVPAIVGRVVTQAGDPVAGARVWASLAAHGEAPHDGMVFAGGRATTDADGRFHLVPVAWDPVLSHVVVQPPGDLAITSATTDADYMERAGEDPDAVEHPLDLGEIIVGPGASI